MASVDDRIVRMEFDNAAFERKLASTLASLKELDKALKFTGASKGLTDLSTAAKSVDVSHISQGIEGVSKSFIALSTIAITALAQITSSVITTGAQIAKSFTVAPLIDGFREYETQLNSVQTILANTASKGTTLDQVNDALQRLNEYSDQTIYNFGQMARNIGTFTAAGVDLETSVLSIKGIANLAAMSGSNAEQASNAMYQLSQAIATGSLKLIDWNSVVNAGMGGEAFKTALFETGKAMGTLMDVPVEQTFKEWEASGQNFRESLQEGWITAEVLTQTLAGFTGDLTEEMLISKGFTQEVASNIIKTAAIAKAAATEVKTFTQLVGTVKEAVGTGWADSFKIIIGNFTEAKSLWTGVNNSIGEFVNKNANARNALLQGWKDLGGRDLLIMSLGEAFKSLGAALEPIKNAFQFIFPPMTAERLIQMTQAFANFVISLKPSEETINKISRIFAGLFSVLSIGWEILKEGARFLAGLVRELLNLVDAPGITEFIAKIGDGLVKLQTALVTGGGIKAFFAGLGKVISVPLSLLGKIKDAIGEVFGLFDEDAADAVGESVDRLGDRFENVKRIFERVGSFLQPLEDFFAKVKEIFDKVFEEVSGFISKMVGEIKKGLDKADFSEVLDALNTGLLLAITGLLAKFLKDGFNIGFQSVLGVGGGFFDTIQKTFGQLTTTLEAMQTNIKASALLKIAGAIAILTASVLVLSMIDSEALTKALAAMAVGFAELMTSFAVLTKLAANPIGAAAFTILSTGLIALASALLILTLAVRSIAKLSWEELAKGLGGITALLGILIVTTKPLAANSKGMVVAGVGITALAIALTLMGAAVAIFGNMEWETLAKGLGTIALLLAGIAGALQLMPASPVVIAQAAAVIGIAFALNILAAAVAIFGNMEWETIAKGFVSVAAGLAIIAGALHLMPASPIVLAQAAALVIIGFALNEIAAALKIMATMSWEEVAKGLVTLAGSLAIIAGSMHLMTSALPGAAALLVVAFALGILAGTLKLFSAINWGDLLESLGKLALAVGVIALISVAAIKATPFILALAVALGALGLAFALFGVGVFLVGKGLEAIAKAGDKAAESLLEILKTIARAIPELAAAAAEGFLEFIKVLTKGVPVIVKFLGLILSGLITELTKLVPKVGELIVKLMEEIFTIIRSYASELVETGLFILMEFLRGIRDNIGQVVTAVGDIVVKFLEAMQIQIPRITTALADTIIAAVTTAAYEIGRVSATLMFGVAVALIEGFFQGLQDALGPVGQWLGDIGNKVVGFIGDLGGTLLQKGMDLLNGFFRGIQSIWETVFRWFRSIGSWIVTGIGDLGDSLLEVGKEVMRGLWRGLKSVWEEVTGWLSNLNPANWFNDINLPKGHAAKNLLPTGKAVMGGLQYGMQQGWKNTTDWLSTLDPAESLDKNIGANMTKALKGVIDQMNMSTEFQPTITPVLDLTEIAKGASMIGDYIQTSPIVPAFSYGQAQTIASDKSRVESSTSDQTAHDSLVKFEQNIYSPTELSTSAIYKNTRNQITMAKEELSIP